MTEPTPFSRIRRDGESWIAETEDGDIRKDSPGEIVGGLVDVWMDGDQAEGSEVLSSLRLRRTGNDLWLDIDNSVEWAPCWTPSQIERSFWDHVSGRLRALVQDTHDLLCTSSGWAAQEGSKAENDLSDISTWIGHGACESCPDYFGWMRGRTAWAIGHLLLDNCIAYAATLDSDPPAMVSWQSAARGLLETSGNLSWLLEETPYVSNRHKVVNRVVRWFLVEWKSATEKSRHFDAGDEVELLRDLEKAAAHFGIDLHENDTATLGAEVKQKLPRPSDMPRFAQELVVRETDWTDDDWSWRGSVYGANYSSVAHARLYGLRDFREADDSTRVAINIRLSGLALAAAETSLSRLSWYLTGSGLSTDVRGDQRAIRDHWLQLKSHAETTP